MPTERNHGHDRAVILSKTGCMQLLAGAQRAGYHHWSVATIEHDRAQDVVRKLCRLYETDLSKDARYRRKKLGAANTMMLLWQHNPEGRSVTMFLLATDQGLASEKHPIFRLEQMRDARKHDERIVVTGYELVRVTRPGVARPVWTWRMTDSTYQGWRDRIVEACGRPTDELVRQAWWSLHAAPGFGPIREQCKKLKRFFSSEWQRRKGSRSFPAADRPLLYLDFITVRRLPLSAVIKQMANP